MIIQDIFGIFRREKHQKSMQKRLKIVFAVLLCLLLSAIISAQQKYSPDMYDKLGERLKKIFTENDTAALILLSDSLYSIISSAETDSLSLADACFFSGLCNYYLADYDKTLHNMLISIAIRKKLGISDIRYEKSIFNAGVASLNIGDHIQVIEYMKEYLEIAVRNHGPYSNEAADAYTALAGASIECLDYDGFTEYSLKALAIISHNPDSLDAAEKSNLYTTIGVGNARMGDYAKARMYLEMAGSLIRENNIPPDGNHINFLNSLAITYGSLGIADKEDEYFEKGIRLAAENPSDMAFNLYNNYAAELGREGNVKKGENVLLEVLEKAEEFYGRQSRSYIEALKNYAIYLTDFTSDTDKVIALYNDLLIYTRNHEKDAVLNTQILSGYARILFRMGELEEALVIIRDILYKNRWKDASGDLLTNPPLDSLPQDRRTLRILQLKYNILHNLSVRTENLSTLESAANTAELIIAMIDRIRNSITEEESRIILGDNFRNSYLFAIRDFELCYRRSGNRKYLEKAFEYAERSKVAGLLAATRQMKAVQFHIPGPLAERENALRREISFYNSKIASENIRENPDRKLLDMWNTSLLRAVTARDSLVRTFEKEYPGYYSLKYSTRVPSMKEIPSVVGRNQNYINYIVSDSLLYVFVVNRKYRELITIRIDDNFMCNISDLRNLLAEPSFSGKARTEFNRFLMAGTSLYAFLIKPAEKYLLSKNLLISPDNLLSYLPFEVLLRSGYQGKDILYRKLHYLMNDYNISYAYSATFINEKSGEIQRPEERMVAFAPSYPPSLGIDSIFADRHAEKVLYDLPEARNEADYVAGIAGGKVYSNLEATESRFKAEAGKYGIVHLAMHTVVSDQKPMNSAMIFAGVHDTVDDGLLRTYEVYGIPMKARMVVLSSCNTGFGTLSSGEGILSLARGFLYSGSRSVVMSLWRIDDRSGTEIVKMFYEELKKGRPKSKALRYARNKYLDNADQLKSHPYFWSALVVFGDNSPVFFQRKKSAAILILVLMAGAVSAGMLYFRKRR